MSSSLTTSCARRAGHTFSLRKRWTQCSKVWNKVAEAHEALVALVSALDCMKNGKVSIAVAAALDNARKVLRASTSPKMCPKCGVYPNEDYEP